MGKSRRRWDEDVVPLDDMLEANGASRRQLMHFGQIVKSDKFNSYDFGPLNEVHYEDGVPIIPVKNIEKVPIVLYVGTKDKLATVGDN